MTKIDVSSPKFVLSLVKNGRNDGGGVLGFDDDVTGAAGRYGRPDTAASSAMATQRMRNAADSSSAAPFHMSKVSSASVAGLSSGAALGVSLPVAAPGIRPSSLVWTNPGFRPAAATAVAPPVFAAPNQGMAPYVRLSVRSRGVL
eukprot:CAMPEP_0170285420 /NCGR_PEP_ID=MMETSP0116_2-20130129/42759_1 /TAXON_ID=400756 /ORGANISM="Durinskia baltica, Strain CSIRO CS-38" /LENGTH=144 /DNA_ID=CAMNT_0010536821 /DNA_START=397 /DNA_END=828 /DNA_ORIENTATION=-